MSTPTIAQKSPYMVDVEKGKTYYWCACGNSKSQPLCDGTHKGSAFAPVAYLAAETKKVALCGCKRSKKAPTCDGTHKAL